MKMFVVFAILILGTGNLLAADRQIPVNLQSMTIEDFENAAQNNQWQVKGSSSCDLAKSRVQSIDTVPKALEILEKWGEPKEKSCLGIKSAFRSQGYNWVAAVPAKPISLKGRVKNIEMWVCGMNYRYTAEIWVKDFRNFEYKLVLGKLDFIGWKLMSVELPQWIPQEEESLPKERPLVITKIVFRADPDERADRFYCYIDHMKVITNTYIERYDGDDITVKMW